jgi:hypothetical protein
MFCLQPPIPKIPTIILAVIPIPEDLPVKADDLTVYTWKIITGLLALNIPVISYATDGGTVERSVQRKVEALATSTQNRSNTLLSNLAFPILLSRSAITGKMETTLLQLFKIPNTVQKPSATTLPLVPES